MASSKILSTSISITNKASNLNSMANGLNGDITGSVLGNHIMSISNRVWGAKYLYMVYIDRVKLSGLSSKLIPVYSVNESVTMARTENIKLPIYGNFKIPVGRDLPSLQISMYDTDTCEVEKNIRSWASDVTSLDDNNFTGTVGYLDDIISNVFIFKLDHSRKTVLLTKYRGYPEGEVTINMSSDSGLKEIIVDINVTEVIN